MKLASKYCFSSVNYCVVPVVLCSTVMFYKLKHSYYESLQIVLILKGLKS